MRAFLFDDPIGLGALAAWFRAPLATEIFAGFAIETVATRYSVAGGKWSDVCEIIVKGPAKDAIPPPPDLLSL